MKKGLRKLQLNRETLRHLDEIVKAAVGGITAGACHTTDPSVCGTNCTLCDFTDTCTHCSNACM